MHRKTTLRFTLIFVVFFMTFAHGASTVVLSTAFVETVKNKATLQLGFEVDIHRGPHGIGEGGADGDIHMAGRSDAVRLPLVAEIVNARLEKPSSKVLEQTVSGSIVEMEGVWRLWFEHPSKTDMVQGTRVEKPTGSNPNHVFEIHPITQFATGKLLDSFVPIVNSKGKKYAAYSGKDAFRAYEALKSTVKVTNSAVTITSSRTVYNYAEFEIELAGKWVPASGGYFVLANVFDLSDEENPLTSNVRRMVFVKGTQPADALLKAEKNSRLHVLGIPRVNLAEVAAVKPGSLVKMNLPYEMIIVAVFPD
jgi:hypothetical protein